MDTRSNVYPQSMFLAKKEKIITIFHLKNIGFKAVKIRSIFECYRNVGITLSSRKHLRTKVTPDFHLTYSKMGEISDRNQDDKKCKTSIFLHKIICCGCVLDSPRDSNIRPKHMLLWRSNDN